MALLLLFLKMWSSYSKRTFSFLFTIRVIFCSKYIKTVTLFAINNNKTKHYEIINTIHPNLTSITSTIYCFHSKHDEIIHILFKFPYVWIFSSHAHICQWHKLTQLINYATKKTPNIVVENTMPRNSYVTRFIARQITFQHLGFVFVLILGFLVWFSFLELKSSVEFVINYINKIYEQLFVSNTRTRTHTHNKYGWTLCDLPAIKGEKEETIPYAKLLFTMMLENNIKFYIGYIL